MKITIGTPMYGGQCHGEYMMSVMRLKSALEARGDELYVESLYNESLIQRARNRIASRFLKSESDKLLFIDADVAFSVEDALQVIDSPHKLVGGVVPLKGFRWDLIWLAANYNVPTKELEFFSGNYNVNFSNDPWDDILKGESFPVDRIGTAFLCIDRIVFEQMLPTTESYMSDTPGEEAEKHYDFFPVEVRENRIMSEDYSFCNRYTDLGGEIHAFALRSIVHFGNTYFKGNIAYEAALRNIQSQSLSENI